MTTRARRFVVAMAVLMVFAVPSPVRADERSVSPLPDSSRDETLVGRGGSDDAVGLGSSPPMGSLRAVGSVVADLPPPEGKAANPEEVKAQAKEITSQPEYQPPPKSLTERALEEFQKFLARFTNTLSGGGVGSAFGWLCLLVLVGAVGYLLFRIGRTVQRSPQSDPDVTIEVHRSPTEWRAEAEKYEAQGLWKDALRCRYRAMVADLVDRDVVPDIPGRTVGEHRQDVHLTVPDASSEFHGAAELFERAWYGDLPTGQDENQQFRQLSDRVVEKAGS